MRARIWIPSLLMLVAAFVFAGCGGGEGGDTHGEATHTESASQAESAYDAAKTTAEAGLDAAQVAILTVADQADGTEDHVVSKCANCMLKMDGKAEFAVQAGDYEMHFCSEKCKEGFSANMQASLQKLAPAEEADAHEGHQH